MPDENQVSSVDSHKTSESERLLNVPRKFEVAGKQVIVESQPAGAVTLILSRIIDKAKQVDLEVIKGAVTNESTVKENVNSINKLWELFQKRIEADQKIDFEIIRLMLVPAKTWMRKRGQFTKDDYPVTMKELEWETTEETLLSVVDEWFKRNPRIERSKKMLVGQANPLSQARL